MLEDQGPGIRSALRDIAASTRALLESRKMMREAKTEREQRIADEAYRQRQQELAFAQQQLTADRLEFDKGTFEAEKEKETRKAEETQKAKARYGELMTTWQQAPDEKSKMAAASALRFHGELHDLPHEFLKDELDRYETEEREKKTKELDDEVLDLYTQWGRTPDINPEKASILKKLQGKLLERDRVESTDTDPFYKNILENINQSPEAKRQTENIRKAQEEEPALKSAMDAARLKVTDENITTEDKGNFTQAYQAYKRNQDILGKKTPALDEIFRNLEVGAGDKAKGTPLTDPERRQKKAEIEQAMQNKIITQEGRAFLDHVLDTDRDMSDDEYQAAFKDAAKQYATGKGKGTAMTKDQRIGSILDRYVDKEDFGTVMTTLATEDKYPAMQRIDHLAGEKKYNELDFETKDAILQQLLSTDIKTQATGETTRKLLNAPHITMANLAILHKNYERVKDKIGLVANLKEKTLNFVGLTSDPEVGAFVQAANEYISTDTYARTGAQAHLGEFIRIKGFSPRGKADEEFNDVLFRTLGTSMKTRIQNNYTRVWGQNIGKDLTDYEIDMNMENADDVFEQNIFGDAPTPRENRKAFLRSWERDKQRTVEHAFEGSHYKDRLPENERDDAGLEILIEEDLAYMKNEMGVPQDTLDEYETLIRAAYEKKYGPLTGPVDEPVDEPTEVRE